MGMHRHAPLGLLSLWPAVQRTPTKHRIFRMEQPSDYFEIIAPGETASVENVTNAALPLSFLAGNGSYLQFDLLPGQIIELGAGNEATRIVLREGDPSGLLVIKPESAS